jgi:hypothetical protein
VDEVAGGGGGGGGGSSSSSSSSSAGGAYGGFVDVDDDALLQMMDNFEQTQAAPTQPTQAYTQVLSSFVAAEGPAEDAGIDLESGSDDDVDDDDQAVPDGHEDAGGAVDTFCSQESLGDASHLQSQTQVDSMQDAL